MKIAHVNAIIWYLVCQYLDRYPFLIDLLTTRVSDKEGYRRVVRIVGDSSKASRGGMLYHTAINLIDRPHFHVSL